MQLICMIIIALILAVRPISALADEIGHLQSNVVVTRTGSGSTKPLEIFSEIKPLTCSEMLGDLYQAAAQQRAQQQQQIVELTERLAAAQAEVVRLKAASEPK